MQLMARLITEGEIEHLENIFITCCVCSLGYWFYRNGKRAGSKAAYRVGRNHGRRRRR